MIRVIAHSPKNASEELATRELCAIDLFVRDLYGLTSGELWRADAPRTQRERAEASMLHCMNSYTIFFSAHRIDETTCHYSSHILPEKSAKTVGGFFYEKERAFNDKATFMECVTAVLPGEIDVLKILNEKGILDVRGYRELSDEQAAKFGWSCEVR